MQAHQQIVDKAVRLIEAATDLATLDQVRIDYLGKKGQLTQLLKQLGKLPAQDRPSAGQAINQAKQLLQQTIAKRKEALQQQMLDAQLLSEKIDVTLPPRGQRSGGLHPVTQTFADIQQLFM